jgi:hypothetical protein
MKKVFVVLVLSIAVLSVNAQETKKAAPEQDKSEKVSAGPVKSVIKEADLLQPIKDNIAKDFAGAKIQRAIKMDNKGVVNYSVMVKKDNSMWSLLFDKDGNLLRKNEMKAPKPVKVDEQKPEEKKAAEKKPAEKKAAEQPKK